MANGLLTKQLVNKAILMMKDSAFWTWDDNEHAWQSSQFKSRHVKKEEAKEKVRAKVGSKELVKHTLVKNKHKTLNGGQKKIVFGGPKVKRGEKGSSKGDKLPL